MKKISNVLVKLLIILVILLPQVLSEVENHDWQTRAVFLICSVAIIIFLNFDKYKKFQISKDGVSIEKTIDKAEKAISDLKYLSENIVSTQLKHIVESKAFMGDMTRVYNGLENTIKEYDIENEEIKSDMNELKLVCYHNLSYDVLCLFRDDALPKDILAEELYSKLDEEHRKISFFEPTRFEDEYKKMRIKIPEEILKSSNWKRFEIEFYETLSDYSTFYVRTNANT